MRKQDAFSGYHPAVNFLYYAMVLLFSMCLMHPAYLLISLTGALAYDISLRGRRAVRFAAAGLLPMALFAAAVNPAFNHEGATILTYLPGGNPLTLESILYGAAAAAMLAAVVLWFSSYQMVMTSDKFVYLFGRIIPALSLVLSMALRFIPRFRAQLHTVGEAQACLGRDTQNGNLLRRMKNALRVFSITVTWSLENAIETADRIRATLREKGYRLFCENPTNQIFVVLENAQIKELEQQVAMGFTEKFDDTHTVMRICTSWATRSEDVDALIALL